MSHKRKISDLNSHTDEWDPRIPPVQHLTASPSSWQVPHPDPSSSQPKRARTSSQHANEQENETASWEKRGWAHKIDKTKSVLDLIAKQGSDYKLADFLEHLLNPDTFNQLDSNQADKLRRWLRGETRKGTRPAEIVDAMYRHPAGLRRDRSQRLQHPLFTDLTPPTYSPSAANSCPQTTSLLPPFENLNSSRLNSREGLEEWMVRGTLIQVEREAEALADSEGGLARGAGVTWDILDDTSNLDQRQTMQTVAPVIWAIMSTIAFLHRPVSGNHTPASRPGVPIPSASEHTGGGKKGTSTRDPTFGVMFALSILISFRNPLVNFVQCVIAVFLFACSAHKTVYRAFNRIGMSISHSSLHGHLKDLGESSRAALKALGRQAYESSKQLAQEPQQYFMLVFDNVNKYHTVSRRQTVAVKNEMKNGTAATAVILEDVPLDAFDPKPYIDNIKRNDRTGMTLKTLFEDIDNTHLSRVGAGMVMRILCAYIPALSGGLHSQVEARFQTTEQYAKHLLRLRRSIALSFGTSSIEENTPRGASNVMHDLVGTQMEMQPEWFDDLLVLAAGDQLSIKQLETAKKCKAAEKSIYESRRWVLPIIQLWHMKLAYLRSIFRVHWFNTVQSQLFGLHHGADALGRHINPDVNDFYACHNAVKTIFETMVLTATFVVLHEEIKRPLPTENIHHMITELSNFFAQGAPFYKCSIERLETLAEQVYERFMTTRAYHKTLCLPETTDSNTLRSNILKSLKEDANARQSNPGPIPSKISACSSHSNSDQMLGNLVLFMRDTFMYLEFASAIPQGDIGRVMEIIKVLRFSFYGSHAQNYGKELLEMACRFMFEYPAKLQTAILNNWLINPSGLNGHWQENDFFQEHSNKAIKTVFNTKTSDWDSAFLRDTVSVNIRGLSQLKDNLLRVLGLTKTGSGTSKPNYSADINVLAAHYLASKAFTLHQGRTQDALASDMFTDGYSRMSSILPNFLEQSTSERAGIVDQDQLDQETNVEEVEEAGARIPLAPLIIQDGMLMVDDHETGDDT